MYFYDCKSWQRKLVINKKKTFMIIFKLCLRFKMRLKVGKMSRVPQIPLLSECWQLQGGGLSKVVRPTPTLSKPSDVLVRVCAASVNPLGTSSMVAKFQCFKYHNKNILLFSIIEGFPPTDSMMVQGYGREVLGFLRSAEKLSGLSDHSDPVSSALPRVLGRDLSGEVVAVGRHVSRVRPGDHVWGAVFPAHEGTHQQYAALDERCLAAKPSSATHLEAASLPYAGLTAWAALQTGGVARGSRVLVVGGAGGVGTIAIQLLAR